MTSINREFLAIACAAAAMMALVLVSSDEALAESGRRGGSGVSASTGGQVHGTARSVGNKKVTRALSPMSARTQVKAQVNSISSVR